MFWGGAWTARTEKQSSAIHLDSLEFRCSGLGQPSSEPKDDHLDLCRLWDSDIDGCCWNLDHGHLRDSWYLWSFSERRGEL